MTNWKIIPIPLEEDTLSDYLNLSNELFEDDKPLTNVASEAIFNLYHEIIRLKQHNIFLERQLTTSNNTLLSHLENGR